MPTSSSTHTGPLLNRPPSYRGDGCASPGCAYTGSTGLPLSVRLSPNTYSALNGPAGAASSSNKQ